MRFWKTRRAATTYPRRSGPSPHFDAFASAAFSAALAPTSKLRRQQAQAEGRPFMPYSAPMARLQRALVAVAAEIGRGS